MSDEGWSSIAAEQVYANPSLAIEAAEAVLAEPLSSDENRGAALWVLGRSAYYANQMAEAVRQLTEAFSLVAESSLLVEVLLTLAPALSKEGRPEEALRLLDNPRLDIEVRDAGQLRNQRGIILTELGRLPEAQEALEQAVGLLRQAGDSARQARTLVNLGAVASMMGDQDAAERHYIQARDLTMETGEAAVAAAIEGNLGYVESRRGRFGEALEWYNAARSGFAELGEVGLLVATLETDHARTLLDVGLYAAAATAAESAFRSAYDGGNKMLQTQSQLLLGEALVGLGEHRRARGVLADAIDLAEQLGIEPWRARGLFLGSQVDDAPPDPEGTLSLVETILQAGWPRESHAVGLHDAQRQMSTNRLASRAILTQLEALIEGGDVDRLDKARRDLLLADLDRDTRSAESAFVDALDRLSEMRDLLGSVEMRASLSGRLRPVRQAALARLMSSDGSADEVLEVLERTRSVVAEPGPRAAHLIGSAETSRLRDTRVTLDEAKMRGDDIRQLTDDVDRLERAMLAQMRTARPGGGLRPSRTTSRVALPADTAYVTFAELNGRVLGLRHDAQTFLTDVGSIEELRSLARSQRSALRRLADERRSSAEADLARVTEVSQRLRSRVCDPLGVEGVSRLVVTPGPLVDVSWVAVQGIGECAVTIAPTLGLWAGEFEPIAVRSVASIGGPGLASQESEIDAIHSIWEPLPSRALETSCAGAMAALSRVDLAHVAAHGSFRSDNPFFSSIVLSDGHLTLLELSELERVPEVVILASCDGAAGVGDGDVVVGTAAELRRLGSKAVIAPTVTVNDTAAADYSVRLFEALWAGRSIDDATMQVGRVLAASGDPRRIATGLAFHVFGGASTRNPLAIG